MFTRLVVGSDGSPGADTAFEQAVILGRRFRAALVVVHAREPGRRDADERALERARTRAEAASLHVDLVERPGAAHTVLLDLAQDADALLIGRHGSAGSDGLGSTAVALVRAPPTCVVVCGAAATPMRTVALAFDGREPGRRALEMAAQFASVGGSTLHVIHANADPEAGQRVVGAAEATLSLHEADFTVHVQAGTPGAVVARVVHDARCDAVFVGAHTARPKPDRVGSHTEQILRQTDVPVFIQP